MFYAHKIKSILPHYRVLEIGPGNSPHPRSDILLERQFSQAEALKQRGGTPILNTTKPVVYYDGDVFPFEDGLFDYVICSHVLEHVENLEVFCTEMFRVAQKGYMEFPTIYCEYLYNFSVHTQLLHFSENKLIFLPKAESGMAIFQPVQDLFYRSLELGYVDLVEDLKPYMFQGIEWLTPFTIQKARNISELTVSPLHLAPLGRSTGRLRSLGRKFLRKNGNTSPL